MPSPLKDQETKELSRLTKDEWREYTKTVWQIANVVDRQHPAAFPPEIPRRLIKMFTFVGETVLDPFAGTGTTAFAALELDRLAIAIDQNTDYVRVISERVNGNGSQLRVKAGDCRKMGWIEDESVSLVVTSPPYWNKADYGARACNLGNINEYLGFIESLRPAFQECYRVLMPGRKIAVVTANVNQFTDDGLLSFPLAADLTVLLRAVGFGMINDVVWSKDGTGGRWGSWGKQRPIFGSYPYPPNFLFKTVHEHILIFAKPPTIKKKGPKVRLLGDLMRVPKKRARSASAGGN